MTITDTTKFAIGIAFAVAGVAALVMARRSRGFDQKKQAGALMVGAAILFVAMGLGLVKFGISGNVRPALMLSAIKLLLMPAVALGMAWALDLPPLAAKVAVVTAALPSGVNSYLIATQFGTGQGLASNAMTIGTAAAVLTSAFWLAVTQAVFG